MKALVVLASLFTSGQAVAETRPRMRGAREGLDRPAGTARTIPRSCPIFRTALKADTDRRDAGHAGGALRAIVYERYGLPEVLHPADVAAPVPGRHDVVVMVLSVS